MKHATHIRATVACSPPKGPFPPQKGTRKRENTTLPRTYPHPIPTKQTETQRTLAEPASHPPFPNSRCPDALHGPSVCRFGEVSRLAAPGPAAALKSFTRYDSEDEFTRSRVGDLEKGVDKTHGGKVQVTLLLHPDINAPSKHQRLDICMRTIRLLQRYTKPGVLYVMRSKHLVAPLPHNKQRPSCPQEPPMASWSRHLFLDGLS